LNAEDSTKGLEIYQKHLKQTDSLINYYENAKTLSGIIGSKLPTLKPPPETFLKQMKSYVENPENFNEDDEKNDNVTPLKDLLGFDESKGEVKFDDIFETSKHNEDSPENSSNTKSHGGNDNDNDGFGPSNDDPFSQDPFTSDDPFSQDPFSQDPFEAKPQKTTSQAPQKTTSQPSTTQTPQKTSQPSTTQAPQKTSQPQKTTLDLDDLFSSPSNVQPVNTYPTTKPQNPFSPTPQQFTPKPVQSNPFSPVPVQSTNPFQQPQTNPFQQPQTNPFQQPQSNPFQQPQTNPFQNPYQQPQQGSFGQPKQNYYGGPQQNLSQPKQNNPGFQKFDFSESQVVKPKQTETHAFDFLTDITKDAPKKQNQPQPKQQGSFGQQQQGFGNDPFNDSDPFAQNDPFGSDPF
jgi:hypothetical protein